MIGVKNNTWLVMLLVIFTTLVPYGKAVAPKHVNIAMIIDNGQEAMFALESSLVGAMVLTLGGLLKSNNTIGIVSREVFYAYTHLLEKISNNEDINPPYFVGEVFDMLESGFDNVHLYLSLQKKFVVIVPRSYTQSLSELGFLKKNLRLNTDEDFLLKDPPIIEEMGRSDMEDLFSVFDLDSAVRRRIYLAGHGGPASDFKLKSSGAFIANLERRQYQDLLLFLNEANVDFLFVSSCYAGGWNMLAMHKMIDRELEEYANIAVNFPIVVLAVSDAETPAGKVPKFQDFFEQLDLFISIRGGSIKNIKMIPPTFSAILDRLGATDLKQTASVRLPGRRTFFKPIDMEKRVFVINYATLLKHELIAKIHKKSNAKLLIKNKEGILFYPSIVPLPLVLEGYDMPAFISMIPGKAYHYIESVSSSVDFEKFLKKGFFDLQIASPKVFFIKQLICPNNPTLPFLADQKMLNLKNVVIEVNQDEVNVIFQTDDKQSEVYFFGNSSRKNIKNIDWKEYKDKKEKESVRNIVQEIITEYKPREVALEESTEGRENIDKSFEFITRALKK